MILSVIKYFKGYVYVRLSGYAPERFLNLCGSHDILIWNLIPCEDGYCFCISIDGFRSLAPILRKTKTHIRILRKTGLPFFLYRYRRRKLFAMGLFLCACLLFYLSGFIWNIEINGNSYLSDEVILDFLTEEKAAFGTKIAAVDCPHLEEAMRSRYPEVIWTSVKIYGTKMTVDIQENLLPEENYEQKEDDTVYDITAAKDGVIVQMVTRSGTPCTAEGMEVKKGDLLVSGAIPIQNDDGEIGAYLYRSADADITAHVIYPYRDELDTTYVERVMTGETRVDRQIQLFGYTIKNPFFRVPERPAEIVTDVRQLHIADNFYLPIYLVRQTYRPYKNVRKTYTAAQLRQLAAEHLQNYLSDLEEKGIQILEKNVMIEKEKKKYAACGTISACESIVSYQPAEKKEIKVEERQLTDELD